MPLFDFKMFETEIFCDILTEWTRDTFHTLNSYIMLVYKWFSLKFVVQNETYVTVAICVLNIY